MASSKVMTSSTTNTNSDHQISLHPPNQTNSYPSISIPSDHSKNLPSVTMDDILKNIYVDSLSPDAVFGNGDASVGNKASIMAGTGNEAWIEAGMTLEEYLSKAGVGGGGEISGFGGVEAGAEVVGLNQFGQNLGVELGRGGVVIGNGRGKRKAVVEPVVDKATQQKQKRMIKNRESAARSRERKQQYTNELENQVMQLEEEREQLLREETEERNRRRQLLIENIIPVEEKQKQPRRLRRTSSMEW